MLFWGDGLPFRYHNESAESVNQGNYVELVKFMRGNNKENDTSSKSNCFHGHSGRLDIACFRSCDQRNDEGNIGCRICGNYNG